MIINDISIYMLCLIFIVCITFLIYSYIVNNKKQDKEPQDIKDVIYPKTKVIPKLESSLTEEEREVIRVYYESTKDNKEIKL